MLSAIEAAKLLGVSSARVRALAKSGALPAQKIGRAWSFREEDVMQRVSAHPRSGRPRDKEKPTCKASQADHSHSMTTSNEPAAFDEKATEAHEIYLTCRKLFSTLPSSRLMGEARSQEEEAFYMSVSEFFLQQKQRELIMRGVF